MQTALLIGLAVVVAGFASGWILRRRAPALAHVCHFGAAVLIRVLAAVALSWGIAQVLAHPDALRVVAALALAVPALWSLLSAALMSYALVHGPDQTS